MTESVPSLPTHSVSYAQYFEALNKEVEKIYKIAEQARAMGYDPTTKVEIPPAHDVAARVEATLGGPVGVADRIRELIQEYETREEVAFAVAGEIATGKLGAIKDEEKAADKAVRVALAILTESITAAPIEGISKVKIQGHGNSRFLALYLAGPIRAAGGTEAAMTVLVADYVRQVIELPPFVATEREIERAIEEVELYARYMHLQYPVEPELVRLAASRLPIMLTGDPTEEFEVTGSRDIERIGIGPSSNRVRGGAVLVLNDGVVGRATKLAKIVNENSIKGWEWLNDLAAKTSKAASSEAEDSVEKKLEPKSDYLADVIGGRPVFSHPSSIGGFRLRYGRSRNTGLAGVGVHPATMYLVDEFLAPGTHIRTERPGKGSIVAPVDTIEGPIVLLKDKSVKQVFSVSEARKLQGQIERILYLGDILVALGEFLENNHPLVPSGYCEEWWSHDLERVYSSLDTKKIKKLIADSDVTIEDIDAFIETPLIRIPTPEEAILLSTKLGIPLHPRYLYRWSALTVENMLDIRSWLLREHEIKQSLDGNRMVLPFDQKYKILLEKLGVSHTLIDEGKRIQLIDSPLTILSQLGEKEDTAVGSNALEAIASCAKVPLKDKMGFSIGARMGRPEKAQERKMRPPVQVLFPVGRSLSTERRMVRVAKSTAKPAQIHEYDLTSIVSESAITTNYEISGLTSRQTLAARIYFDKKKKLGGVVVTQVELYTDGSNVSFGLYESATRNGTESNIKFQKTGITSGFYNSSAESPSLKVVIEGNAWKLGIVDAGDDATPANTRVIVRGYPLISKPKLPAAGVKLELVNRVCPKCKSETFESRCSKCGVHTEIQKVCSNAECRKPLAPSQDMCPLHPGTRVLATKERKVDIRGLLERVKAEIDEPQAYDLRAVLGLTSDLKIPEYLGKGILRAKHDVYCYRDGTARFDVTDAPLTHFRPREVGVPVSKLRELGYISDHQGAPLISDMQILELKVQDLIVPENCADYLVRVGRFVDDSLEKIYKKERYYNFKAPEDTIGQLVVGLAPHTSAGIIGRIVGFTNASVCYAHPFWHAAKRRNCDGDEDAIILVLDALINFSKEYLPAGRGGFMDAPLVLSVILNPEEVDDESHNIEVCYRYPAEFYEMVAEAQHPKAVQHLVDIVGSRLGNEEQYEGFGFTHDTSSIDAGPRNTRYKALGTMAEKLEAQLHLAILLDAVDSKDVAERVLSHHFIRDIRGNLRAYSTQKIRCRKCNRVYRRIPMSGKCTECGSDLLLTVSQRNISKYLAVAEKMMHEHGLSQYLRQRLKLINAALDSLFFSEQTDLTDFFDI